MKHTTLARQLSCGLLAAVVFACAVAPRAHARQAKAFDFADEYLDATAGRLAAKVR